MSAAHTMTLHTDINPFCCAVLRARVGDGSLPPADVLCGDVRALDAADTSRETTKGAS